MKVWIKWLITSTALTFCIVASNTTDLTTNSATTNGLIEGTSQTTNVNQTMITNNSMTGSQDVSTTTLNYSMTTFPDVSVTTINNSVTTLPGVSTTSVNNNISTSQYVSTTSVNNSMSTSKDVSTITVNNSMSTSQDVSTSTVNNSMGMPQDVSTSTVNNSMGTPQDVSITSQDVSTTTVNNSISTSQDVSTTSQDVSTSTVNISMSTSQDVSTTTVNISMSTSQDVSTSTVNNKMSTSQDVSTSTVNNSMGTSQDVSTTSVNNNISTSQYVSTTSVNNSMSTSKDVSTITVNNSMSTSHDVSTSTVNNSMGTPQDVSTSTVNNSMGTSQDVSTTTVNNSISTSQDASTTTVTISTSTTQDVSTTTMNTGNIITISTPEVSTTSDVYSVSHSFSTSTAKTTVLQEQMSSTSHENFTIALPASITSSSSRKTTSIASIGSTMLPNQESVLSVKFTLSLLITKDASTVDERFKEPEIANITELMTLGLRNLTGFVRIDVTTYKIVNDTRSNTKKRKRRNAMNGKLLIELIARLLSVPYILDVTRNPIDVLVETIHFLKQALENINEQKKYTVNITENLQRANLSVSEALKTELRCRTGLYYDVPRNVCLFNCYKHNPCENNGVCTYSVEKGTICLCQEDHLFSYSGNHCELKTSNYLIGASVGISSAFVLVLIILGVIGLIRRSRKKETQDSDERWIQGSMKEHDLSEMPARTDTFSDWNDLREYANEISNDDLHKCRVSKYNPMFQPETNERPVDASFTKYNIPPEYVIPRPRLHTIISAGSVYGDIEGTSTVLQNPA